MNMKKKPSLFGVSKTTRVGTYTVIISLLALAICVAVNLLVSLLPQSVKLLNVSSYPFSDTTKELLNGLDTDVHITYVFSNSEDQSTEEETVYPLLTRYCNLSNRVTLSQVDPVSNPDYLKAYGTTYVKNNIYLVFEGRGRSRVISADHFFSYVFQNYGTFTQDEFYQIYQSAYSQLQQNGSVTENTVEYALASGQYTMTIHAENDFNQALAYVSAEKAPMTYLISPAGTLNTVFAKYLAAKGYTYQAIDPASSDWAIPENAECLLVCMPTADFTDAQAAQIKTYLANGGKLILCTEEANLDMKNLMTLAADYGLAPGKGQVVVTSAATSTTEAKDTTYEKSHYIQVSEKLPEGVTANAFMVTGKDATSVIIDGITSKTGALTMGVSVKKASVTGGTTQVVWYSSHEILEAAAQYAAIADQYAGTSYSTYGTYTFIQDTLDCMSFDELVKNVPDRSASDVSTYLTVWEYNSSNNAVTKPSVYFWEIALIALVPLALIAAAVAVWFVRSRD